MFKVELKGRHPTGSYQRAGIRFNLGVPHMLEKVPDAVAKDGWLIVTEVPSPEIKKVDKGNDKTQKESGAAK